MSEEDIEFESLVAVLNRFPGIVARLLAAANSAWCQRGTPVTSLHSACANLGLRLVRSISISVAVSAPFNVLRCPSFDVTRFWSGCLLVAESAQLLARQCSAGRLEDPETVYTTGLLHNIGLLWLADQFPDELETAFGIAAKSVDTSLPEAMTDVFGIGLPQVSALVLGRWGIPEPLVTAIENYGDPAYMNEAWEAAALVGCSTDIVAAVSRGNVCPRPRPSAEVLGITRSVLENAFHYTQSRASLAVEIARDLGKR